MGILLEILEAQTLAMKTDYARFAVEDTEKINQADAGAFFLEGYLHAFDTLSKFLEDEKIKM